MTLDGRPPIIIAHRGASAVRPEHTLEAYRVAIEQGADYIEPDLVSTKDGVLVSRHENEISGTTNVAEVAEFGNRRTTKTIDGMNITGWFTEDFTLAELKKLRARERIPAIRPANTAYNDRYEIPTLQEIIELAKQASRDIGRVIGIYPETKHPTYFKGIGLAIERSLVETLHQNRYLDQSAPIFIQSFEVTNLKALRSMTKLKLIQLINDKDQPYDFVVGNDSRTYADLVTKAGLKEIADYADGIGPAKSLVIPRDNFGRLAQPTQIVEWAHNANLAVHPWTFRPENEFLPVEYKRAAKSKELIGTDSGDGVAEIRRFVETGIDGFFTDLSANGRAALQEPA